MIKGLKQLNVLVIFILLPSWFCCGGFFFPVSVSRTLVSSWQSLGYVCLQKAPECTGEAFDTQANVWLNQDRSAELDKGKLQSLICNRHRPADTRIESISSLSSQLWSTTLHTIHPDLMLLVWKINVFQNLRNSLPFATRPRETL